ncbi:heterokaryon incompatibility protein-domain-containing protein [Podospora aff. communis PSN243]|uniref:Heterokaryon incompatibility protein-domain-containing protein n=1 Tax=Podospora aff. communis PSN243 TaxID=3040156 RepID=A0AAV9G1Q1_9PEZI|nr:heterokaryon incompatibility protein-domain-containing protein [Podospora aff. communis PSN243]
METSTSTVVYQPLERKFDIRLLNLEPGHFDAPIQCTLQHANLNQNPAYMALSYVWGDPAIVCNGANLRVRVNLRNALRRLRKSEGPVVVWADALCINQADIAERSSQVRIMADIYKKASQVVVGRTPTTRSRPFGSFAKYPTSSKPNLNILAEAGPLLVSASKWKALSFRRHLWYALMAGASWPSPWNLELLHLLRCTARSLATEPLDKLFALYGLADDINGPDGQPLLKADYTMTLQDALVSVMGFFISKGRGFTALGYAGLRVRDGMTDALPSWIPDWSIPVVNPLDIGVGDPKRKTNRYSPVRLKATQGPHYDHPRVPSARSPSILMGRYRCPPGNAVQTRWKTVDDAFWRTLIANQGKDDRTPGPEFRHYSIAWWFQNRLADLKAEDLGRTATSPHLSDEERAKYYREAMQRVRDSQLPALDRTVPTLRDDPFVVEYFVMLRRPSARNELQHGHYLPSIGMTITNRSFIVTEDGSMGLAPGMTRVGDVVVIIAGANTPFVLRPVAEDTRRFQMVGEAYVHGVMNGEAVKVDHKVNGGAAVRVLGSKATNQRHLGKQFDGNSALDGW